MLDLQCRVSAALLRSWQNEETLNEVYYPYGQIVSALSKSMSFYFIAMYSKRITSCLEKIKSFSCFQQPVLKYNFTYSREHYGSLLKLSNML